MRASHGHGDAKNLKDRAHPQPDIEQGSSDGHMLVIATARQPSNRADLTARRHPGGVATGSAYGRERA